MTQEFINNLADKLQKVGALHAIGETWISIDSTIPAGGVPFLGQLVNRSVWADLFAWATDQGKVKTESEWQTYASANGGNCPFYSDGDGSTTFRMPKVVGYIKGASSQAEAGAYAAEGLPNIEGTLTTFTSYKTVSTSGAFSGATARENEWGGNTNGADRYRNDFTFSASKSNSIYGNSEHVTPETHSILIGVYAVGVVANIGSADATQFLNGLATVEANLSRAVTSVNGVAADAAGAVNIVGTMMPDYSAGVTVAPNATVAASVDSIYYGQVNRSGGDAGIYVTLFDPTNEEVLKQENRFSSGGSNGTASVSVFVPKGYKVKVTATYSTIQSTLYPIKGAV